MPLSATKNILILAAMITVAVMHDNERVSEPVIMHRYVMSNGVVKLHNWIKVRLYFFNSQAYSVCAPRLLIMMMAISTMANSVILPVIVIDSVNADNESAPNPALNMVIPLTITGL